MGDERKTKGTCPSTKDRHQENVGKGDIQTHEWPDHCFPPWALSTVIVDHVDIESKQRQREWQKAKSGWRKQRQGYSTTSSNAEKAETTDSGKSQATALIDQSPIPALDAERIRDSCNTSAMPESKWVTTKTNLASTQKQESPTKHSGDIVDNIQGML